MLNLYSLAWRSLLAASLVLNPVAGVATTRVADGRAAASLASARPPPCHEMTAEQSGSAQPGRSIPEDDHGCGCGNPACQFAACCGAVVFDVRVPTLVAAAHRGAQALPARVVAEAASPPPGRMIRPPIA